MKNMKQSALAIVLLVTAAFTACKKDKNYTMDNQSFVTMAASSNNFEVAAGLLAQTKGSDAAVVHFGEHMVNDHGAVAVEMKALVDRKGLTLPTSLQAEHQANLTTLTGLSGNAFDRAFVTMMVTSHQQAINLFTEASREAQDEELRIFAESKLPSLRSHLEEAMTLKARINP